jgi:Tol biopolymer transport system component
MRTRLLAAVALAIAVPALAPGAAATAPPTRLIAFVRDADRFDDLLVVRGDGRGLKRIARDGEMISAPAWSPDGRSLVVALGSPPRVVTMRADGSRLRAIAETDDDSESEPAWSSEGKIAFVRGWDIVVADSAGSDARPLGIGTRLVYIRDLTWSPDGRTLAFTRDGLGAGNGIWFVDADGQILRRLPGGRRHDEHPRYSPDGTRLAFAM